MIGLDMILQPVRSDLEQFEHHFDRLLHSDIPLADQVVQYIARYRGKRLRPILTFLCARLHGKANSTTLQSGIVVELLHTATLVHDDVVDDSDRRRGMPTVNNMWNNKISVLVGDYLFSKTLTALVELQDSEALTIFSQTAQEITEGELLQIERANDFDLAQQTYFELIEKKTASLFCASCELGTLSVDGLPENRRRMREFGKSLGLAFQIQDDVLDYIGDRDKLGKPTGNDIRENKITLPLIHAFSRAEEGEKQSILDLFRSGKITDIEVERVVDFARRLGGVDYARRVAADFAQSAKRLLQAYPPSDNRETLERLVDFAILREK